MNTRLSGLPAPSGRWALIDFFIPEVLRRLDHRDILYKARALVLVHLVTLLTLGRLWRELQPHLQELGGLKVISPILGVIGTIVLISLMLFRRTGSFTLAAHLYGASSTATILCVIAVSGGFLVSPGMPWWPILLMLTFIMGGWSVALTWAAVGLLLFLTGMNVEAVWSINVFTPEHRRDAYVSSVILCGVHMMIVLWFLEFCQRQLLRRANVERDRALFSAAHDPLTGLANRKAFRQRVSDISKWQREVENIEAVLMIDLNDFKLVNDELGHQAGDQVLITIARRLRSQIRRDDLAARLGGDEFAVLLSNLPCNVDIEAIAHKLYAAITAPMALEGGRTVAVGASIGIALDPDDGESMEALLHNADMAMYEAKALGHSYMLYRDMQRGGKDAASNNTAVRQPGVC